MSLTSNRLNSEILSHRAQYLNKKRPEKFISMEPHIRYPGSVTAQIKNHSWVLRQVTKNTLKLEHPNSEGGWYQLKVKYHALSLAKETKLAKEINSVFVEFGDQQAPITLIQEKTGLLSLTFHSPIPLKHIELIWPTLSAHIKVSIQLKRVSQVSAVMSMLRTVSRREQQEGGSWQHIYRITRARQKRVDWPFALQRLVQTYHPMLCGKTLLQTPYAFWRQHFQPKLPNVHCQQSIPTVVWMPIPDDITSDGKKGVQQTIQSLIDQTHQYWQLNLLTQSLPAWLEAHLATLQEDRVQITSYNKAQLAPTAWHSFIECGDQWPKHALALFAQWIAHNAEASLVYSDHDEITVQQERCAPAFKPQWNPELLKSNNYMGRAVFFNGQLIHSSFLAMPQHVRCLHAALNTPTAKCACIHIPHILFHQRRSEQQGIALTERQQVQSALKQLTQNDVHTITRVTFDKTHQVYHAHYRLPAPHPRVSIIIPTRNGLTITRQCVESILRLTSYPNYQITIVNNQSDCPDTLAWFQQISQHSSVQVLDYNQPFNYSAINNFAVAHSDGDLVCLLNNDTEVIHSTWLTEMVRQASRPDIGCVGAKLLFFDDTIQHAGVILGIWGLAGHAHKHYSTYSHGYQKRLACSQNYSAVTAACLLVKRSLYESVGGLDEKLTVAFNDVDFCLKVQQAGYYNLWTPRATLYHYESKSRGKEDTPAKKAREQQEITLMKQRWPAIIQNDPHYSRHLTRHREDFTLRLEEEHFEATTKT
ncbi:glycosyltransferase family 2 protein [Salinivibrio sp. PR5]|uniref:glycosyltransferase family 2 protein n=1 Tax=Salinivibrio sp. PR5 TaxID=1909484 RepID=UPI0013010484|nr:glycosyltransferase family 2 protein [Salinivibrio sp. PR5]